MISKQNLVLFLDIAKWMAIVIVFWCRYSIDHSTFRNQINYWFMWSKLLEYSLLMNQSLFLSTHYVCGVKNIFDVLIKVLIVNYVHKTNLIFAWFWNKHFFLTGSTVKVVHNDCLFFLQRNNSWGKSHVLNHYVLIIFLIVNEEIFIT